MDKQIKSMTLRGGKPLNGEIIIRGAKNAISKEMVASLLTSEKCVLENVARVRDIEIMKDMISEMGATVNYNPEAGVVEIDPQNIHPLSMEAVKRFSGISRIPTLTAGPMLARFGETFLPRPGGCSIGQRPIDFHIMALEKMGAVLEHIDEGLKLTCPCGLKGAKIRLDYPSVGATEQVLLAAVLAEGVTELSNAAIEPEIMDLILVLQKMGAYIMVDTDRVITIHGVKTLNGYFHVALPDRTEAASWACAAAATNGRIFVRNARQIDLVTFLNKFRQAGGEFAVKENGIEFWRSDSFKATVLETDVHPGFMTDWQQPFVIMLTQAEGMSIVHETVYEDRFGYTQALNSMGAKIQVYKECLGGKTCRFGQRNNNHSAAIMGPTPLKGATIDIPDLRAGFSYVIAAFIAEGETVLNNIDIINRGYEYFIEKLQGIGADIVSIPE
ncbi:MAG: UDP-N-acetylglucosamine 1-carboxyvinyltransferase [bacterium]